MCTSLLYTVRTKSYLSKKRFWFLLPVYIPAVCTYQLNYTVLLYSSYWKYFWRNNIEKEPVLVLVISPKKHFWDLKKFLIQEALVNTYALQNCDVQTTWNILGETTSKKKCCAQKLKLRVRNKIITYFY